MYPSGGEQQASLGEDMVYCAVLGGEHHHGGRDTLLVGNTYGLLGTFKRFHMRLRDTRQVRTGN